MSVNTLIKNITPEVREYIYNHEKSDVHTILLKNQIFEGITNQELVNQIIARRKAKSKLPSWYNSSELIYPSAISLEQASSEWTARWKAENFCGDHCLDLTGGLGVDSFWLSKSFAEVNYVETNPELVTLAIYNHRKLGSTNIVHINDNADSFLLGTEGKWDLIYIDPSRRKEGNRVTSLDNYEPNVVNLIDRLKRMSKSILIKMSPFQDIADAFEKLGQDWNATILVYRNECRELLFTWQNGLSGKNVKVCHLETDQLEFIFEFYSEKNLQGNISPIKRFLFEPNAGIMKSGGFKSLGERLSLPKIHPNTHLYTSENLVDFPGRSFEVIKIIPNSKKHLKLELPGMKANLAVRNFPDGADHLQKKLGITPGGENYIFALTDIEENLKLVLCRKASKNIPRPGK